jgi:hypothetical protein
MKRPIYTAAAVVGLVGAALPIEASAQSVIQDLRPRRRTWRHPSPGPRTSALKWSLPSITK